MNELIAKVKCSRCSGTGVDTNNQENPDGVPCTSCDATGFVRSEVIDITIIMDELDWIKKKIKKMLQKLEIPDEE